MGKRANNEGSVYQRSDGRWCAACQVNGRRKYIYGKTQSEVLAKLRDVQAAGRGVAPPAGYAGCR